MHRVQGHRKQQLPLGGKGGRQIVSNGSVTEEESPSVTRQERMRQGDWILFIRQTETGTLGDNWDRLSDSHGLPHMVDGPRVGGGVADEDWDGFNHEAIYNNWLNCK